MAKTPKREADGSAGGIRIDINGMMAAVIGEPEGLTDADFQSLEARLGSIHESLGKARQEGRLDFARLPVDKRLAGQVRNLHAQVRGKFDDLVVLGIGGSALGARALYQALRPANHHLNPGNGEMRLHVADNIDPSSFGVLMEQLALKRTLFNVVSKSGQTAETMSQFLCVRERLLSELGGVEYQNNVVVTTDASDGYLRQIVNDEGFPSLVIPGGLGGRFSVLSAVGLFPAVCTGIDIEELLAGAARMAKACEEPSLYENPAYLQAAALYLAHLHRGRSIVVMMPYSDRLGSFADWFCQLWAESLGKQLDLEGQPVRNGQTPVRAVGTTDQHSQLQLYAEGPADKVIIFLRVEEHEHDLKIPRAYEDLDGVGYLGGLSIGRLLNMEQQGTELALAKRKCMTSVLTCQKVTAGVMGELMCLLEYATVVAGGLYNVNPFDQPGVEEGKLLTYGLAGRRGFEEKRAEVEQWLAKKRGKYIL